MFSIQLAWKSFNVAVADVETWMKANAGPSYCGNSADTALTLWFSAEPEQTVKDAVEAYWSGITEASSEATRYLASGRLETTIQTLKAGLVTKSWDAMSVAERKLATGQTPTREELGL